MMNGPFITTELEIKRLGQNILIARKRRKMTTSELAAKANVSRQVLMRIERGDSSVGISKVFNVLNALGLLNGISSFIDPEMDRSQALKEIRDLRESSLSKNKKTEKFHAFSKNELNF
jgi:transcriptional regulator with XRE-family HTH domain